MCNEVSTQSKNIPVAAEPFGGPVLTFCFIFSLLFCFFYWFYWTISPNYCILYSFFLVINVFSILLLSFLTTSHFYDDWLVICLTDLPLYASSDLVLHHLCNSVVAYVLCSMLCFHQAWNGLYKECFPYLLDLCDFHLAKLLTSSVYSKVFNRRTAQEQSISEETKPWSVKRIKMQIQTVWKRSF